MEIKVQFKAAEPGERLGKPLPGDTPEDRVVCPAGIGDLQSAVLNVDGCLAPDKMAVDRLGVALLEAPELFGQHTVEGVGNHGHQDVKVHLHQDGGRQGVEVEELDRLGDDILHAPSAGIVADDEFRRGFKIVGDQECRPFMAVAPQDDLPELPLVIMERDDGLMDKGIGVLPLVVGDVDLLPGTEILEIFNQFLSPSPQGDELDAHAIQYRKMFVGGKLGIENKGGGDALANALPEGQDVDDLFIGLFLQEIGRCIEHKFGGGILGKKGQGPLHPLALGAGPMFLEDRFIPVMGDGVEIQIDDASVIQAQTDGLPHKGLLEFQDVNLIEGIGVGGHGRALGQEIEAGEQPQPGIESVIPHMTITLCPNELQGQKGQKIAHRRDGLAAGKPCGTNKFWDIKALQKRRKQKDARRLAGKMLPVHLRNRNPFRSLWGLCTLDGQPDLQSGATGKLGKSLFRQDSLHRSHRDIHPVLGKQLRDLTRREFLLPPSTDLPASFRSYPVPAGATFRNWLGEVHLAGFELMPQQMNIREAIPESLCHGLCRQALHEGGPEGFVSFLPFVDRVDKVVGIAHEYLIQNDGYDVKKYFVKM